MHSEWQENWVLRMVLRAQGAKLLPTHASMLRRRMLHTRAQLRVRLAAKSQQRRAGLLMMAHSPGP